MLHVHLWCLLIVQSMSQKLSYYSQALDKNVSVYLEDEDRWCRIRMSLMYDDHQLLWHSDLSLVSNESVEKILCKKKSNDWLEWKWIVPQCASTMFHGAHLDPTSVFWSQVSRSCCVSVIKHPHKQNELQNLRAHNGSCYNNYALLQHNAVRFQHCAKQAAISVAHPLQATALCIDHFTCL